MKLSDLKTILGTLVQYVPMKPEQRVEVAEAMAALTKLVRDGREIVTDAKSAVKETKDVVRTVRKPKSKK